MPSEAGCGPLQPRRGNATVIDPKRTRLLLFLLVVALAVAVAALGGGWAWDGPDDLSSMLA